MPRSSSATLGTLLRHLIELLDGAVEQSYVEAGLDYRPRYTPVVRALMESGSASIRTISRNAGITHSAVSQTVAQMIERGLARFESSGDARERIVALTPAAQAILPKLLEQWRATDAAATKLDTELSMPLSTLLREAIDALEHKPFADRIQIAAAKHRLRSKGRKQR